MAWGRPVLCRAPALDESFCVMRLSAEGLNDQTNYTVGSGIRKQRPIQPKGKVEVDACKHDRAGKLYERQIGSAEVSAGGVVAKAYSAQQLAMTKPALAHIAIRCFMLVPLPLSDPIVSPILSNSKRDRSISRTLKSARSISASPYRGKIEG